MQINRYKKQNEINKYLALSIASCALAAPEYNELLIKLDDDLVEGTTFFNNFVFEELLNLFTIIRVYVLKKCDGANDVSDVFLIADQN
jgi:hypothetical protein